MKFIYPVKITKDEELFVAEFPDLDACHTYGESIEEVITLAAEALTAYLETLLEQNVKFNDPSQLEKIDDDCILKQYIYCDVDLAKYSKSVKKTLTIPAWLNDRALAKGINFSQLLQEALYKAVV